MSLSGSILNVIQSMDAILSMLADAPEGHDLDIPSKLNALVETLSVLNEAASKPESDVIIPFDLINSVDELDSCKPIEEVLLKDFDAVEHANEELKSLKTHFSDLSSSVFSQ